MATLQTAAVDSVSSVSNNEAVTETVITAVADAKGVDPLELEPLYSAVDPDALNSLFSADAGSLESNLEVRFTMSGCQVVVRGDGEVVVTPAAGQAASATIGSHGD